MGTAISRFARGFGVPFTLFCLIRLWRLVQIRKRLVQKYPGLCKGENALLGNSKPLTENPAMFLRELHAKDETGLKAFMVANKACFSVSDLKLFPEIITHSKAIGPFALAEAEVLEDDLAICEGSAHEAAVQAALRETKSWYRSVIDFPESTDELVFGVIMQLFFRGRANEHIAAIRAACLGYARRATVKPSNEAVNSVKVFFGLDAKVSICPSAIESLRRIFDGMLANERENERRLPNRLKEHPSVLDVALERNYSATTLAILFLDSLQFSSSACMWLFFSLAQHPGHQEQVLKEADNFIGRRVPPKHEELASLVLLESFTAESIRLHAPIPFVERRIEDDVETAEITLPRGGSVFLAFNAAGVSSKNFPHAQDFDLTRTDIPSLVPPSILPVQRIGITVAKAIAAVTLQRFFIKADSEVSERQDPHIADFSRSNVTWHCRFEPRSTGPTL